LISTFWNTLQDNSTLAGLLALSSLLILIGSLLLVPWILISLPEDYFHNPHHRPLESFLHRPVWRGSLLVLKNALGILLLMAGIGMLVLPGQGVLTILVALILIDFPGKFYLKKKLISIPSFHKVANHIRHKKGKAGFQP